MLYGYVVAWRWNRVETPEPRKTLVHYYGSGGIVLSVHRDSTRVLEYLQTDKPRPAYDEDMMAAYIRRLEMVSRMQQQPVLLPKS